MDCVHKMNVDLMKTGSALCVSATERVQHMQKIIYSAFEFNGVMYQRAQFNWTAFFFFFFCMPDHVDTFIYVLKQYLLMMLKEV